MSGVTSLRDFSKEYEEAIGPGSVLPVTDTELGKIACLVERDLMPEAMRIVAAKGAEIVIQPTFEGAGSGGKVHNRWLPYAAIKQCLAYMNGTHVLSATFSREEQPAGSGNWVWFDAQSRIVGPDGMIEAQVGGVCDGWAAATIDPIRLRDARQDQANETQPADFLIEGAYSQLRR